MLGKLRTKSTKKKTIENFGTFSKFQNLENKIT